MADNTTLDLSTLDPEKRDIVTLLRRHRGFLLQTVEGMTDEQATSRPTVSELTLAGIVKHVAATQKMWVTFIQGGAQAISFDFSDPAVVAHFQDQWRMVDGESLATLVAAFEQAASEVDQVIAAAPDLNAQQELPAAPWFTPGEAWSVRRIAMHLVAEISQHAGHADIIREAIDGSKTMG